MSTEKICAYCAFWDPQSEALDEKTKSRLKVEFEGQTLVYGKCQAPFTRIVDDEIKTLYTDEGKLSSTNCNVENHDGTLAFSPIGTTQSA